MKVGLQTWGSDGDIFPFIALAGGLSAAGHDVTLAITAAERKSYAHYAERLNFKLTPMVYVGASEGELLEAANRLFRTRDPMRQLDIIMAEMYAPCVEQMHAAARALCADSDILVGHFIAHTLEAEAQRAHKPYVTVALNHGMLPTRHAPPPALPNMGAWLNRAAWATAQWFINRSVLPIVNDLRARLSLPLARDYRDVWESPLCNILAVSPLLCQPRADWGANQRLCGFLRMPDERLQWDDPAGLREFLSSGPAPVYMTFGSMMGTVSSREHIAQSTRLLVDAALEAGVRAIVQSHWQSVDGIPKHRDIYRIAYAPHQLIVPECAAVVHHGGAGTTQMALLCGKPSVVVAHIVDQYIWARELQRIGAGARPLERRTVKPKDIAREIKHALNPPEMTQRARALGSVLAKEDGVGAAVRAIEGLHAKV